MKDLRPLCMAIVDALLFFESSAPDEIDPDIAVRAMENIGSNLLLLDEEDQRELRRIFIEIADRSTEERYGRFVRAVPDLIGIAAGRS